MDVIGIGLANIDLVAHVDERFLGRHQLTKGHTTKLSAMDFIRLRGNLSTYDVLAGGCAANTICGLAQDNIKCRFYGKVGDDAFASTFISGFQPYSVFYNVSPATEESSQCAVLITPDGERSFAFTDGASWALSPDDLDFNEISHAGLIYTEIYAMVFGRSKPLWPTLINHLRQCRVPLAVKVIDRDYAALYRASLFALAEEGILTLLVGNADNLPALTGKKNMFDVVAEFQKWSCAVLLTDGARGAHYINGPYHETYTPHIIETPRNSSGAGDQFAAGFLSGFIRGHKVPDCLNLAGKKAKAILMTDTPRPPIHKT